MLDKNIFVNITSNSYSKFLTYPNFSLKEGILPDQAEQVISIHYKTLYLERKNQNWLYRIFFYSLALLFTACTVLIYFKSPNFSCGLYFKNCEMVKNFINLLCLALAAGAFGIGSFIRPEKEALSYLTHKIQKELGDSSIYKLSPLFQDLALKKQVNPVETISTIR